jgi:hypothetical protein
MKHRLILVFLATTLVFIQACVFHTTGETEVGVRTKKLGFIGKQGVEEKVYAPGSTYIFLPYINDWHTFDTKLQNLKEGIENPETTFYLKPSTATISAWMSSLPIKSTLPRRLISCSMWQQITRHFGKKLYVPLPEANPEIFSAN